MRRLLEQLAPVLRLTRVTTAFAVVADVWFVILWTRANTEEAGPELLRASPLWLLLLGGAATALGLYAFGACMSDVLDTSRDRALKRDRPIPGGGASGESAVFVTALSLMIASLGATVFGTVGVAMTLTIGGAILAFNAAARFVPGFGLVLLAAIYGGHMLIPNPWLRFVLPVWLVMTHAMVVAGVRYRLERRSPVISRRAAAFAIAGWLGGSLVLLLLAWRRGGADGLWPDWLPVTVLIGPAVLAGVFGLLIVRWVASLGPVPRTGEKIGRYGTVWLGCYGIAWMVGAGHFVEAAILGALVFLGLVGMTALRESYALIEHPMGYRR